MQWIKVTLKLKRWFAYSNTLPEAAWQPVLSTENDYEDIVAITRDRVILMRDNDVDFFTRAGNLVSGETLTFGDPPDIDAMLRYAHDLYLVLDTDTEKVYLLGASGAVEWQNSRRCVSPRFNRDP